MEFYFILSIVCDWDETFGTCAQMGPLNQLRTIDEIMKHWWSDNWQGKAEVLGGKIVPVPLSPRQSHTDCRGILPGSPWCYMPSQSRSPRFHHYSNIWRGVPVTKLLSMTFSPACCYFPSQVQISSSSFSFQTSSWPSDNDKGQVTHRSKCFFVF
jgi:hypothetical protein